MIKRYKDNDLNLVADFLQNKAIRSPSTALCYSFGLDYLNKYIQSTYDGGGKHDIQSILKPLAKGEKNQIVYHLLNGFVSYLQNSTVNGHDLSARSVRNYMIGVKSYLLYNGIDISQNKFKYQVTMPPIYHEGEQAIDSNDVREILNHCNNRRLKAYVLVLASGGMRAVEALAIRVRDLDFNSSPTEVHIRKEYAKTRRERFVYISDEATKYVKEWLEWKYRDQHNTYRTKIKSDDDLVFSQRTQQKQNGMNPPTLYNKLLMQFQQVLDRAALSERKEDGVYHRRKITFHSLRRMVKTIIANQTNSDFSEHVLGHSGSTYYRNKREEQRRMYKENCMKYLTFLDFPTVEATGANYEAKLREKDQEIEVLKQRGKNSEDRMTNLEQKVEHLMNELMKANNYAAGKGKGKKAFP
jgi:integrase